MKAHLYTTQTRQSRKQFSARTQTKRVGNINIRQTPLHYANDVLGFGAMYVNANVSEKHYCLHLQPWIWGQYVSPKRLTATQLS
jgi:hypothetical protein